MLEAVSSDGSHSVELDLPADGSHSVELCTDRDEWNSFVERNDGPPYAHWGWGEAVRSYGHDHWNLVVREQDTGKLVAALPLTHVESRLFGSQLLSPAFAERGSIVPGREEPSTEAVRLLCEQAKRLADSRDADVVSLRGSTVGTPDDFAVENQYVTFQAAVDREVDAVWADVKDSRQRQIEQAADNGTLQFRVGDSLEDLRAYYRLYLETMRGHGSPPHSFAFFRTLWDHLHPEGALRLGMVTHDGSLINGMIDLTLGTTVYQWGVVSDYDHRELNGGSLLLWKSLEWAAENGYDTYEFGRTREGTGVYMFKKSFGGSKVWYDDHHYFPGEEMTLPDPDEGAYELATDVWQRLPLSVTRIVGPHIRKRIGL